MTKSLHSKKTEATKREHARVYENMCLPPRDIGVEHNGEVWVKSAWTGLNCFGWEKWERIA